MKKIAVLAGLLLMLATHVYATPILINLNGEKSVDGGTFYGSVIYDEETNKIMDRNYGLMYTKPPTYLPGESPTTWIELEPGVKVGLSVLPLFNQIKVADVSSGAMPLYTMATDKAMTLDDLSWVGKWAIRVNKTDCSGCTMGTGPNAFTGYLYTLPQYKQPTVIVQVPEVGAFWYLFGGVAAGFMLRRFGGKSFVLGVVTGLVVAAGSVSAYTWDMNRSPSDNLNRSEESQQQQEMLNLQRENNRILQEHRSPC